MNTFKKNLDPHHWGSAFYAGVFLALLAINLFSPKGILHWILLKQETNRLQNKISAAEQELNRLNLEQKHFHSSDVAKLRAIREELGLLKSDEIAIEFTDTK